MSEEKPLLYVFVDLQGSLDRHKDPKVTLSQMRTQLTEKGFPNLKFYILSSDGDGTVEEFIEKHKLESEITGYASSTVFKKTLSSSPQPVTLTTDLTQREFLDTPPFSCILIDNQVLDGNPKHLRFGALQYEHPTGPGCEEIFSKLFFVHFKQDKSLVHYVDKISYRLLTASILQETSSKEEAERAILKALRTPYPDQVSDGVIAETQFPSAEIPIPLGEDARHPKRIGKK